jgi:hypothetical protein
MSRIMSNATPKLISCRLILGVVIPRQIFIGTPHIEEKEDLFKHFFVENFLAL